MVQPFSMVHTSRLVLIILLLAGCAPIQDRIASGQHTADDPTIAPEHSGPAADCLTVTPGAIAGVQWGLDDENGAGQTAIVNAVAIVNSTGGTSWFVAAEFSVTGIDNQVGVWQTFQDPSTAEDAAYVSVDSTAAAFSSFVQPDNYSSAIPGVDDAISCL